MLRSSIDIVLLTQERAQAADAQVDVGDADQMVTQPLHRPDRKVVPQGTGLLIERGHQGLLISRIGFAFRTSFGSVGQSSQTALTVAAMPLVDGLFGHRKQRGDCGWLVV